MKKTCLLLLFLLLAGCSQMEGVDVLKVDRVKQVMMYEVNDSWNQIDDSHITFTDQVVVDDFVKALHKLVRLPGVVDIAAPDYLIDLNGEQFYLWIDENGGSIMDPEDTNTLYRLEEASVKEIYERLKVEVDPKKNISSESVLKSLAKQGLELKEAGDNPDGTFGMKLNGERSDYYQLDGQPVYIYNFYSAIERQRGLENWHEKTASANLESYQVFEIENILIFHVYEIEMDADIHAKFLEGLKFLGTKFK
ncbi:hypothetical protein ACFOZY_01255 [Chungangia koreensis]|uniref:YhfM-like domain-containing protein n=1 Tax=Chungangia koreensis TaxID=752657 RepID=A0ABV8X4R3_9LACT